MVLYGPPGTGKTLMARQIGKMLNGREPKVVSSAIIDKYIGESARLIREMFGYARDHQTAEMPRNSRVKRARNIAAALSTASLDSTPADIPAAGSLPPQPLATHSSPSPPPSSGPLLTQPGSAQLPLSPHTAGSSVASAPPSSLTTRVRGVTRGKNAAKLTRQLGHLIPVQIPTSSHRPEGEHASLLVNHLGLAIRAAAPLKAHGWKKLDSGVKLAVVAAVKQYFDIGDYEGDLQVKADIDRQCGTLYKSWKYELHSHYLELLEQGVPHPEDHPAPGCDAADWRVMISQCWESPAWKAKSAKAKESRAKLPYNHTSGSRSFASRMSMVMAQNAGQVPSITQFFRTTHYREKSNEWVNEVARHRHDALVQRIEEQSQPSVTTSMSEEEIAVAVLGKRSGYLNGYGIFTRSPSSSAQSRASQSELIALQEQVAEQARRQAEQDARQAESDAKQAEQEKRFQALESFVRQLASATGMDPSAILDIMARRRRVHRALTWAHRQ